MKLKVTWWITIFGLFLFVSKSHSQSSSGTWGTEKKTYIDIDTAHNDFLEEEEGTGKHSSGHDTTTDDEDLLDGPSGDDREGTGSGGFEVTKYTTRAPTSTTKKMTACEQLRSSTKDFTSTGRYYIPLCTITGEYEKRQCEGKPGSKKCWCVNPKGVEIPGTQMMEPDMPDCHKGTNLKPCIYDMVKNSRGLLGSQRFRCKQNGEYEKIQCRVRECWCVDLMGVERANTRVYIGAPVCDEPTDKSTMPFPINPLPTLALETPYPLPAETTKRPHDHHDNNSDDDKDDGYEIEKTPSSVDISIGGGKFDKGEEDNNENDKSVRTHKKPEAQSTFLQMIESPGILAAVIGGSVVGLLCAILLVMFIVYRMRKKDEGSYPLEEQKYTNYSYMKAPDKEFYA